MYTLLVTSCAVLMVLGLEPLDTDIDSVSLSADANYCCKMQTTQFGCEHAGLNENCVWLKNKGIEKKIATRFKSRCLVRRFVNCKKADINADCNNGNGTGILPVCEPTYGQFVSTSHIAVAADNKIGEITLFDENLEVDIKFTTPTTALQYDTNALLVVGNDYNSQRYPLIALQTESPRNSGNICVDLSGTAHCLGNDFVWTLGNTYRIQLYFKVDEYFKITINKGHDDEYKETVRKWGDRNPTLSAHPETLPVYASLASNGNTPNVADGVIIKSLKIKSWIDYGMEEVEEEEVLYTINSNMEYSMFHNINIQTIYGLSAIFILLSGFVAVYYFNKKCYDNNNKYIPIDDASYI